MNKTIRFGLPKGRLLDQAISLLDSAAIRIDPKEIESRRLIFSDTEQRFEFVSLKPVDIPAYVEAGVIQVGIVGTDILRELESNVYEPLDLQIGKCKLALAAPKGAVFSPQTHLRIATKYPKTAQRFFKSNNSHVQIVKLEGSVEIAPLLGLADAIVDLVETGRTLRENGLEILEDISAVSAKLVVNRTAMKIQTSDIARLISDLDAVVYANS